MSKIEEQLPCDVVEEENSQITDLQHSNKESNEPAVETSISNFVEDIPQTAENSVVEDTGTNVYR